MIYIGIISFIIAVMIGPIVIKTVKKLGIGQTERNVGAVTHIEKQGTPIMGGFIFIIPVLVSVLLYAILNTPCDSEFVTRISALITSMLAFSLVGFIDDYVKASKARNLGLNEKQKLVMQFAFAFILSVFQWKVMGDDIVIIPFLGNTAELGFMIVPFSMVTIVATVNSANLLDGLDGLAGGVSVFFLLFYIFVGSIEGLSDVAVFSVSLIGGLLGFLVYNRHPAKIFMGDTGSMAIGGAIAGLAIITGTQLFILVAGFIYLIEALSVMIQVYYYKRTKKRVFLMAPIHYHYKKKWGKETKVVFAFIIVQIIATLIGIWAY